MASAAQNFNVASSLKRHVEQLCDDSLEGRAAGTEGEKLASKYIYDQLRNAGVTMLTDENGQDFKISSPEGEISSRNIVGIVDGCDSRLREEYIVVGAHYDNLGVNEMTVDGEPVRQYYSGADGDASGVAIMIELARMISDYKYIFPRSVIFVAFGAGEKGNAGSWYFANRAFEQIGSVKAMVNLDMLGRAGSTNPFQIFSQISKKELHYLMEQTRQEPVIITPTDNITQVTPSDHLPFYEKNIPVFCFTTGMTREYHTIRDIPSSLSYNNMEMVCNYLYHFLWIVSSNENLPKIGDDGKSIIDVKQEKIYTVGECDEKPQFFHSNELHFLQNWVYKYIKYPQSAVDEGVKGTVIVSFIIEKDGALTNLKVEEGVDERLDDEALRVINVSPKWIPGKIGGKKVRTRIILPVEFRLATGRGKFRIKK